MNGTKDVLMNGGGNELARVENRVEIPHRSLEAVSR
jgi:hypothetical protein